QTLVGRTQDVFVPRERKAPDGQTVVTYVSIKQEAARLIGRLPKEGRNFYETTYGGKADGEVKAARGNNDFRRMALTMTLYLHTGAGAEAGNWCASYMLARAEFQGAPRFFQILITRAGIAALKDGQLVKAAYAFHHAGDPKAKEAALKELEKRGVEVKIGGETRTVAELKDAIDRFVASVAVESASDSPIYRGRPNRNATLPGGTPFLEAAWRKLMGEQPSPDRPGNGAPTAPTLAKIKTAVDAMATRN